MIKKRILSVLLAGGIAATALTGCGVQSNSATTTQETTTTTQETTTAESSVKEANMLVVDNDDVKITFKGVGKSAESLIEYIFEVENKKTDGAILEFMLDDIWYNGVQYGANNGIRFYEQVIEDQTQEIRLSVFGETYKIDKVSDIKDVKFIILVTKDGQELYKSDLMEYIF